LPVRGKKARESRRTAVEKTYPDRVGGPRRKARGASKNTKGGTSDQFGQGKEEMLLISLLPEGV